MVADRPPVTIHHSRGVAGKRVVATGRSRGGANRWGTGRHVPRIPSIPAYDALDAALNLGAPQRPRIDDQGERRSPHPFIARIPLTGSLLLPLLISLLLGTAPSPVVALFLIHLPLVGGGLVDV